MTRKSKHTFDNVPVFCRIEEKARSLGLDQLNHISHCIGISATLLSDIKHGSCSLINSHRKTVEKIAGFLGVSVNQLVTWSGEPNIEPIPDLSKAARYVTYMREQLGMNKRDAAIYFGLGKNAFIEYELDKRKASLLLLLVLKVLEDHPDFIRITNWLVSNPDPKQAHPTYFSYMRRKLRIRKRDAAKLFGLGKGTFTQIEVGQRKPSALLLMIFKLIELHPEIFGEIIALAQTADIA
jgi:DNA-binding transcriptional regulator YiaG